jgi:hypothetical protein
LVSKSEEKAQLGRPKRRCTYDVRMDLGENKSQYVDWIHMAKERDQWRIAVKTVMNLWVP